jgi:hypothetical protein
MPEASEPRLVAASLHHMADEVWRPDETSRRNTRSKTVEGLPPKPKTTNGKLPAAKTRAANGSSRARGRS